MKADRRISNKPARRGPAKPPRGPGYTTVLKGLAHLVDHARQASARAVNTVMTATYWEMGRRIVEHEQGGKRRAGYGDELLERLS
ncbi:MAG: DUF1016 domain-containing protein, partial [Bacteroidetes bacterium]|nr:DUF1016 domain-containing protein [Bacteroidota bacterium]